MAFEAFIKRTADGREIDFDHDFEREPVIQIARALYEQFAQQTKYYALLANVDVPTGKANHTRQIDAILLSEDGIGILDFKNAHTPFTPFLDDRAWKYDSGSSMKAGSSNNPYRQIEAQREALYAALQLLPNYINEAELPKRLVDHAKRNLKSKKVNKNYRHFEIAGRVVLTGERFEMPRFHRDKQQQWFDIIWIEDCTNFAKMISFNNGLKLAMPIRTTIIEKLFGLSHWIELESLYRKPFGFLIGGTLQMPLPLLQSSVMLGRSSYFAVRIGGDYKQVSRKHAIIKQTHEGAIIQDMGSRNGTWINGIRLDTDQTHRLKHQDKIILGRQSTPPDPYSVEFTYIEHLNTLPTFDLPEYEETISITSISDAVIDEFDKRDTN